MRTSHFDRLTQIIQHAYINAPAIKTIFDEAKLSPDDIQSLSDLEKIPITSKDRLVELQQTDPPFGGFLTVPPNKLQHIFYSPGPLYDPHAGESAVTDTVSEVLVIADINTNDRVINTFSYHFTPTGLALDEALVDMGALVIPTGVGNADLQIKMMLDLNITAYVGIPSWLMTLIQRAEEMGRNFREEFSLRKAFVSAEPLPPDMRQTFVEKYGLSVTNTYGTAELGFLAYNNEGGLAMRLLDSSIIQVADPETGKTVDTGEAGEVVVTSFDKVYPLIRLGTGDLAINMDPTPGESQQGERSIILVGRVGDAVKVRGMFIHPNQLRFAINQVPDVARAQAVVTRSGHRDELTLNVVLIHEEIKKDKISDALLNGVQSACRVKVDQIEFVPESSLPEDSNIIIDERKW